MQRKYNTKGYGGEQALLTAIDSYVYTQEGADIANDDANRQNLQSTVDGMKVQAFEDYGVAPSLTDVDRLIEGGDALLSREGDPGWAPAYTGGDGPSGPQ